MRWGRHWFRRRLGWGAIALRAGIALGVLMALAPIARPWWDSRTPRICTMVGCATSFTASIEPGPHGMPRGKHELVVTTGEGTYSCSFVFESPGQSRDPIDCSGGLRVALTIGGHCEYRGPELPCRFIDDEPTEIIELWGTPPYVRVRQTVDQKLVLDRMVLPLYKTNQPNGEMCGPTCYYAGAKWTFP